MGIAFHEVLVNCILKMKKFHLNFKKTCRTAIEVERKKKEKKSALHLPRRSRYKNIASLNEVAVCTFCAIF